MGFFHCLAYPFLTAQRRMEAQSIKTPGMLHGRYKNYLSCMYNMKHEEGIRGFYRGFPVYLVAVSISTLIVPVISEF